MSHSHRPNPDRHLIDRLISENPERAHLIWSKLRQCRARLHNGADCTRPYPLGVNFKTELCEHCVSAFHDILLGTDGTGRSALRLFEVDEKFLRRTAVQAWNDYTRRRFGEAGLPQRPRRAVMDRRSLSSLSLRDKELLVEFIFLMGAEAMAANRHTNFHARLASRLSALRLAPYGEDWVEGKAAQHLSRVLKEAALLDRPFVLSLLRSFPEDLPYAC